MAAAKLWARKSWVLSVARRKVLAVREDGEGDDDSDGTEDEGEARQKLTPSPPPATIIPPVVSALPSPLVPDIFSTSTTTTTSTAVPTTTFLVSLTTPSVTTASMSFGSFSTILPTSILTLTTTPTATIILEPTRSPGLGWSTDTDGLSRSLSLTPGDKQSNPTTVSTFDTSPAVSTSSVPTDAMAVDSANDGAGSNRTLVITLSTVLSVVGVVVIAIISYLLFRRRRRRLRLFNRGITPIDDDEIATWKVNQPMTEKSPTHSKQGSNTSAYTHRKAPSLIQYQNHRSPSLDAFPQSPRSFLRNQSLDLPRTPTSAVLARAPNARSGLTDDAVPGDDPFVMLPRRNPSKLSKLPASNHRSRGSRSSSIKSFADNWYGDNMQLSPRTSTDVAGTRNHSRIYSTSTAPPRLSFGDLNTSDMLTALSPPPKHQTEIGRAIG